LTVDEPVYRIAERGKVHVITGKSAVEAFYRQVFESRTNVMGARALNMCVADFGVVTEAVWNHMMPGSALRAGEIDADPGAYYLISHNIIQNFTYTNDAKLIGERVYDDPASYRYERVDPADVVTPELARKQLAPFLTRAMTRCPHGEHSGGGRSPRGLLPSDRTSQHGGAVGAAACPGAGAPRHTRDPRVLELARCRAPAPVSRRRARLRRGRGAARSDPREPRAPRCGLRYPFALCRARSPPRAKA
jgi:hypothetical protein